jgi:hypothetical protein
VDASASCANAYVEMAAVAVKAVSTFFMKVDPPKIVLIYYMYMTDF